MVLKSRELKKVILDTNFLIYCVKQRIDYASQIEDLISEAFEFVVPEQVIIELERLKLEAHKFSDKRAAELALKLLKHNKIKVVHVAGVKLNYADDAIIKLALGNYVATVDSGLKRKIRNPIVIEGLRKLILG